MNNLDPRKEKLVNEFINLSKGKSTNELLPLMLAISNKAKQAGISFTKDEIISIVNKMMPNMSENEKKKLSSIMGLLNM